MGKLYYIMFDNENFVGSPTNKLTKFQAYAATFDDLKKAKRLLKLHGKEEGKGNIYEMKNFKIKPKIDKKIAKELANENIANELLKIAKELAVKGASTFFVTDEFSKEKEKIAKGVQILTSDVIDNMQRNRDAELAAQNEDRLSDEREYSDEADRWYKCLRILEKTFKDIRKIR